MKKIVLLLLMSMVIGAGVSVSFGQPAVWAEMESNSAVTKEMGVDYGSILKQYYDYDDDVINYYEKMLSDYDQYNDFTFDGHAPSFYTFLKKGYLSNIIYASDACQKVFVDYIDNEQAMANIVTLTETLVQYGFVDYEIASFTEKFYDMSQEDFDQIIANIKLFEENKNDITKEMLKKISFDNLSKPLAKSYFEFLKMISEDSRISCLYTIVKSNLYGSTVINMYANNEAVLHNMMYNYDLLKQTGVLDTRDIIKVVCSMDWNSYDGNNYAFKLINLMKETGQYSDEDIKFWVNRISWELINSTPIPEAIPFIKGGYLKYFQDNFSVKTVPEYSTKFLSDFMEIIDLMKQANMDVNSIKYVTENSDWAKTEDTLAIIKYMIANNRTTNVDVRNIFNSYDYTSLNTNAYKTYENIQKDETITNKDVEFIKQMDKNVKRVNRRRKMRAIKHTTGEIIIVPAAVITAPIWFPLLLYGLSNLGTL